MSEKSELKKKYCCKICNKYYSSNSSLCNHNKKFHNNKVTESNLKVTESKSNVTNSFLCKYCNKIFKSKQNKYAHQKNVCKNKNTNIDTNIEIIKLNQIKEEK